MSFYSSICLVANSGVRAPSPLEVTAILREIGIIGQTRRVDEFGNLSEDLSNFFVNHPGREINDSLFAPDSVALGEKIEILDPDGDFTGKGWALRIHGNGYFYPLTHVELCGFLDLPKMIRLSDAIGAKFGGSFEWPLLRGRKVLEKTVIRKSDGWSWFGSQSV